MADGAIRISGLTKDYGSGHGLFDLDLAVAEGEIFGYLGPNGSGKSTTIRLLMGMIRPTRGTATVFGLDSQREAVAVKRLVGYVPGELPQFGGLRGAEIVGFFAGRRGGVDDATVRAICQRLDLDLGRKFREYSRGNKQKLAILLGLMHKPRLLILDEPTGGLDPLNQQAFYDLVRESQRAGATAFLSSHILSEVEHTCTRIGILREGRLVRVAALAELHHIRFHHLEIEFEGEVPADLVRAAAGVERVEIEGQTIRCIVKGSFDPLVKALQGATVTILNSHEPSLEEAFLGYYGNDSQTAAAAGEGGEATG
ncbi:MAG TPA: ABC transporter ATP-binding protein [Candidatus Dormibacteraeota bacterium]